LVAARSRGYALWLRLLIAGACMGMIGMVLPELMGIGYDTLDQALLVQAAPLFLLLLAFGKIVATSICIGLGVPGGMIGPALFAGGALGAALGLGLQQALPQLVSEPGLFAMLGMGAMMSASLQAPLAALTALLELTNNPGIILPGMLAVVIANLTASELFRTGSLFHTMLEAVGLGVRQSPLRSVLRRAGVAAAMDRSFASVPAEIPLDKAYQVIAEQPRWLVIDPPDATQPVLMAARDLAAHLDRLQEIDAPPGSLDLSDIPGKRLGLVTIQLHQSLLEAWDLLERHNATAVLVVRMNAPGIWHRYGVLTRDRLLATYTD
jgi:hypothetical protein